MLVGGHSLLHHHNHLEIRAGITPLHSDLYVFCFYARLNDILIVL